MITVKATREGLIGQRTASGYVIDNIVPFVALPATQALGKFVRLQHGEYTCFAIVLDVGPWNINDTNYVFLGGRPEAESGKDELGRVTNGAGIDLSEKVWRLLNMKDNDKVSWEFMMLEAVQVLPSDIEAHAAAPAETFPKKG